MSVKVLTYTELPSFTEPDVRVVNVQVLITPWRAVKVLPPPLPLMLLIEPRASNEKLSSPVPPTKSVKLVKPMVLPLRLTSPPSALLIVQLFVNALPADNVFPSPVTSIASILFNSDKSIFWLPLVISILSARPVPPSIVPAT